ncbi:class I SAM-dependent methyltransferase [Actinophytocola sp.]|uniref:class I SAM-dependent methyltransferase n=1 Tax=Actinophytocola sp. TaxID=1872138 RepID=UPI002ED66CA2
MSITPRIAEFWDEAADSFDKEADHGLRDAQVSTAWDARLASWLPTAPADVLDLGCGTGSLSLLLARRGHRVTAVDLSPNMVANARAKLADTDVRVLVGDAADPPPREVDAVLVRHLLWTLPDPEAALRRWIALCRPGGRLVLIEGRWATSEADSAYVEGSQSLPWTGGVSAETLASTLKPLVTDLRVEPLTDPTLWGRTITDERYCLIATV